MNKNMLLLWQGQLVSQLGTQGYSIAMMFWLMENTGSTGIMSMIMMFSIIPFIIIGPLAGVLVDNMSRIRIIVVSDVIRGFLVLILAAVLFYPVENTGVVIVIFAIVSFIGSIIRSFFRPAIAATVPDLTPKDKVLQFNALFQTTTQLTAIFGQAIAGALYRTLGAPVLLFIDGVSYLLSAFSESFIKIPEKEKPAEPDNEQKKSWSSAFDGFKVSFMEGLRYVKGVPGMLTVLFYVSAVNFFAAAMMLLMPFYVTEQLNADALWYGFLMASMGVGSIIGSIFISVIKPDGGNRAKYLLGSILLMGVTLSVLGFSDSTWLSLAILMLIGACTGIFNLQAMTLFQLTPPPELRGRVMAFILSATSAALPLGVLLAGALGEWTDNNSQLIFLLAGVCIVLTTVIAAFSDNLKLFLKGSSDTKAVSDTPAVEA